MASQKSGQVQPVQSGIPPSQEIAEPTAEQLIAEFIRLGDWLKAESKRFAEHLQPTQNRQREIEGKLHEMLNALGGGEKANISTGAGTAYISNLMNMKIDPEAAPYMRMGENPTQGREALIDFALDHWEEIGSELLLIQPQKDSVKRWMDEHEGKPPPGISIGWFQKVNIRRS